ncbi:c-type cytochrome [Candidatus Absconditicoccus praedator]|uniref:c-type cytochrome n=1 Tax=Candidatus Absconditicoccus praedator TaxID=2735562 RepID=UPI001E65141F|nr:c-type cytochrome [Candidatus Absconditicoccus praedator]UFX82584.1 c-type cytochrome [Candidatus Absconditicoccus praedator]
MKIIMFLFVLAFASTAAYAGEEAYNSSTSPTCASCHNAGVAGAPQLGDEEDWQSIYTNVDELLESVLTGKGAMPAYEGRAEEDDLINAIKYMLAAVESESVGQKTKDDESSAVSFLPSYPFFTIFILNQE